MHMIGILEGIFAVFVFGSWLFWVGVVALFVAMLWFVEGAENGFKAFLVLVLTFLYLQFAAKLPFFQFVMDHPFLTIGGYLLGGVVYGFFRWTWHCTKFRGRYNQAKAEFARQHRLEPGFNPNDFYSEFRPSGPIARNDADERSERFQTLIAEYRQKERHWELWREWTRFLESSKASKLPVASESKATITMWMTYWPWSLFWTFVRDFVVELWENIYTYFSKVFQKIADRVLGRDIQRDFAREGRDV